jgi:hypothetical protein
MPVSAQLTLLLELLLRLGGVAVSLMTLPTRGPARREGGLRRRRRRRSWRVFEHHLKHLLVFCEVLEFSRLLVGFEKLLGTLLGVHGGVEFDVLEEVDEVGVDGAGLALLAFADRGVGQLEDALQGLGALVGFWIVGNILLGLLPQLRSLLKVSLSNLINLHSEEELVLMI